MLDKELMPHFKPSAIRCLPGETLKVGAHFFRERRVLWELILPIALGTGCRCGLVCYLKTYTLRGKNPIDESST